MHCRFHLIRHGESTWNAENRWQGQADPPLSERGVAQAARLARKLEHVHLDAVVSSDLCRAVDTAEVVAAPHGLAVEKRPALRELDVGRWTNLTSPEIAERYPDEWDAFTAGEDVRRGGGESHAMLTERVMAAFDDVAAEAARGKRQDVAVVSHGGCVRVIAAAALGLGAHDHPNRRVAPPRNASLSVVLLDGRGLRLDTYNDTAHLLGLPGPVGAGEAP